MRTPAHNQGRPFSGGSNVLGRGMAMGWDRVVRWQKKHFREFWQRKSKPCRPSNDRRHIYPIRRISGDHPEYGEDEDIRTGNRCRDNSTPAMRRHT
jgi:hypothetical protein